MYFSIARAPFTVAMRRGRICLALMVILSIACQTAIASTGVPPHAVKQAELTEEKSVSTYVPSKVCPGSGLAVNVIYPQKPRYKEGAPISVLVPGSERGLSFSMHAAQVGFAEVRFAFPGTGSRSFGSAGIFDNWGPESHMALRDVILFAGGKTADYKGRKINELVPCPLMTSNVGIVGWSAGGNVVPITLAKYPKDLSFISWVAFYESAVGSMFTPPNLGTVRDLFLNRHYRQGSAATGQILVDYRRLQYDREAIKNPGVAKKRGEPEIRGVLFFDENGNKHWDESLEFAFNYAVDVGLEQQIYPPQVTEALERLAVFAPKSGKGKNKFKQGGDASETSKGKSEAGKDRSETNVDKSGLGKGKSESAKDKSEISKDKSEISKDKSEISKDKSEISKDKSEISKDKSEISKDKSTRATVIAKAGKGNAASETAASLAKGEDDQASNTGTGKAKSRAGKLAKKSGQQENFWPDSVASLHVSRAYFAERDGSLYIKQMCAEYPDLLVTVFGSKIDHHQRQPDHPHIAFLYNALLDNKVHWLRLNPEPVYLASVCNMHIDNFVGNAPNTSIDASQIIDHLEPETIVKDYMIMAATIAELADRARSGNLKSPLEQPLVSYPSPFKSEVAAGKAGDSKETAGREVTSNDRTGEAAGKEAAGKDTASKDTTKKDTGTDAADAKE